eukprot:TRINITY_DN60117_c0_g1_i1.p1 TRINITY_DN60117_c0_g1~~TRINITY_DN60117_c0_g1_i1.p1  ORF type:complete len:347 (-),score=77.72 TRINITY_DN60117_c0_g1_i1:50-1090(-)
MVVRLEEAAASAKNQFLQFSQLVDSPPPPDLQVTASQPRQQQPIASPLGLGAPGAVCRGGRGQKQALLRLSLSSPELQPKATRGHKPKQLESLKERVVMKSFLPDHLKAECLERMDQVKQKDAQQRSLPLALLAGHTSTAAEGPGEVVPIPGGFQCGQQVMARRDILVGDGSEVLAKAFDKAVVLGPSSSIDANRVCIQFQERRDVELLPYNAALDEIMSADNGRLMQMPVPPPRAETPPSWLKKPRGSRKPEDPAAASMSLPPLTPSEHQFDNMVGSDEPRREEGAETCGWTCQLALGTSVQAGAAGEVRKRALQRNEDAQTFSAMRRIKALESSQSLPNLLLRS